MSLQIQILLAAYNAGPWLDPQINSFFRQTIPDWTLLCSDGGSTDGTLERLKEWAAKFPEKITVLPETGRLTASANFARLLCSAKENAILFLSDQDDVWLPSKLETVLKEIGPFQPEKAKLLYYGDMYICPAEMKPEGQSFFQKRGLSGRVPRSLAEVASYPLFNGCTMAISPEFRKIAIRLPADFLEYQDFFLALAAYASGTTLVCGKEPLILHRIHGKNYSPLQSMSQNVFRRKWEVLKRLKTERELFTQLLYAIDFLYQLEPSIFPDSERKKEYEIGNIASKGFFSRICKIVPFWLGKLPLHVLLQRILLFPGGGGQHETD